MASSAREAPPKSSQFLTRLGLSDPREALLCLPSSYADCRSPSTRIGMSDDDEKKLYLLKLTGNMYGYSADRRLVANFGTDGWHNHLLRQCRGGRTEIELIDERGTKVTWTQFGGAWAAAKLFSDMPSGEPIALVAKCIRMGKRLTLDGAETLPARAIGRVWTKYLGIPGRVAGEDVEAAALTQFDNPLAYRFCVAKLVGAIGLRETEALERVRSADDNTDFESFEELLRTLHSPDTPEEGNTARDTCRRLAALSIQSAALRHHSRAAHPQAPLPINLSQLGAIAATQPEKLTEEQTAAVMAIAQCFTDPKPLNGLLTGDVGTGKTLTYLIPLVAAHHAGAACAIIAPTDLLANQIAAQAIERFGPHGVRVERVPTGAKKIHDPGAILVSTYGLGSTAKRCGYSPQVLVCDEQHKMSTTAREAMVKPWTHVLDATATPIPRSLAAAVYGGVQTFTLLKPPVEKDIKSLVLDVQDRAKGLAMIRWALDTGQKAAVIYPLVESKEEGDVQSVLGAAKSLEESFPGKVAVLHGGLSEAEKASTMDLIRSGERPLIVASTVMETGIDIPSIAGMIVRNADRFGASQLHQLRGRLARKGGRGFFMMMVEDLDSIPEEAQRRLDSVAETNDGMRLAEIDLLQRGFGDVDGSDQSGKTDTVFRLVKLRPEDFLQAQLEGLEMEGESRADERDTEGVSRSIFQQRLFA